MGARSSGGELGGVESSRDSRPAHTSWGSDTDLAGEPLETVNFRPLPFELIVQGLCTPLRIGTVPCGSGSERSAEATRTIPRRVAALFRFPERAGEGALLPVCLAVGAKQPVW